MKKISMSGLTLIAMLVCHGCLQDRKISGTRFESCYCEKDEDEDSFRIDCYFVNPAGKLTSATIGTTKYTDQDCTHSVGTQGETDPRSNVTSAPVTFTTGLTGQLRPRESHATPAPVYPITHYRDVLPLPVTPEYSDTVLSGIQPNCDPNISYYKVNHTLGSVTHLGTCPLTPISVIPVVSNPLQLALTPDAKTLLVTSYDNAINFIDTATDKVIFTLNTSANPSGIAISPDGTRAYVTNYFDVGASLLVVDVATRSILFQIPMPIFYPKHVYLTPDGSQAWVNFYNDSQIVVVDTLTSSIAYTLTTSGIASTGMAFNATGTRAYIAVRPGILAVFDTKTLTQIATIPVGPQPVDVVISPMGGPIVVDSYDSTGIITVIDPSTNQVLSNTPSIGPASCMAWLPGAR